MLTLLLLSVHPRPLQEPWFEEHVRQQGRVPMHHRYGADKHRGFQEGQSQDPGQGRWWEAGRARRTPGRRLDALRPLRLLRLQGR